MTIFRFPLVFSCLCAWSVWYSPTVEGQIFGGSAAQSQTSQGQASQAAHTSAADLSGPQSDEEVTQATWLGIPLPQISMPQISMPTIRMPDMSPVTQPVKSGFNKMASGARSAWDGTKEMFSFTSNNNSPTTYRQQPEPSFWQRLFGTGQPEPEGPQTVGEWMSQPRLDP